MEHGKGAGMKCGKRSGTANLAEETYAAQCVLKYISQLNGNRRPIFVFVV